MNETKFQSPALKRLQASEDQIDKVRLQEYRAALGEKQGAIENLCSLLQDEDSSVRYSAADALGRLGEASPQVVTALVSRLQDEDYSAADALGRLGKASPQVVTALVSRLQDEDSRVRSGAADALRRLGKASPQVVTALVSRLQDENSRVRSRAAAALGRLGEASPQVVTALVFRLQDKEFYKGWSEAVVQASSKVKLLPGVYLNASDDTTSRNLSAAMKEGAQCQGLWVASYDTESKIRPWNREKAKSATAVPCKVLLHQYIGDVPPNQTYDFNQINPFLDNPELVLQRLILPPA